MLESKTAGTCVERARDMEERVCSFASFGRAVKAVEVTSNESLGEAGKIERSV